MQQSAIKIQNHTTQKMLEMKEIAENMPDYLLESPELSVAYLAGKRQEFGFRNLSVGLLDGTSYTVDGNQVNLFNREYYQKALLGQSTLTSLLASVNDGASVNVYAGPIIRNQKVVGVLWGSVESEKFYNQLGLEELERYGDLYIINSDTDLIAEKHIHETARNFFKYVSENSTGNEHSLEAMRQDMEAGRDGRQRFFYDGQDVYIYYNKMEVADWWLMVKVPENLIQEFSLAHTGVVWFGTGLILIVVSIGFYQLIRYSRKLSYQMREHMMMDSTTGGRNNLYLRENMQELLKQYDEAMFLMVKVTNTDTLVRVAGLESVNQSVKDLYWQLHDLLEDGEVVAHRPYGTFEILRKHTSLGDLSQLISRIQELDPELNMIVGVYLIEQGETSYDTISRRAAVACNNPQGGRNYGIYSSEVQERDMQRSVLEKDIRTGLQRREFRAWFQPKYDAKTKKLHGAEALVRWYREDKIESPYIFVPLAEATGQIKEIDMCALEDVCRQLKMWKSTGRTIVPISVNLSRNYLQNPGLVDQIMMIVDFYQVEPKWIEFEITETGMEANDDDLEKVLVTLKKRGFHTALDDFGVGCSSLKTLVSMEFDTIKIDKAFVDGIGERKWEDALEYSIALAKKLHATIVVEGVENEEQYQYVTERGCDIVQGYYFSKPLPKEEFEQLMD